MKQTSVTIIGAGLVGTAMAIYLAKLGLRVTVHERRADLRKETVEAGRSINLALSHRGICTLTELGLTDIILKKAVPVYGRCVHKNGSLDYQAYSHNPEEFNYSVSREQLNHSLLDKLESYDNVKINFSSSVDYANLPDADFIIAADGASSHIRRELQQQSKVSFSEVYSEQSYKELTMATEFGTALDKHYLHIWPCHEFMLIALPNLDGSFTCTLFMPDAKFAELKSNETIKNFFQTNFSEIQPLIPDLLEQYQANLVSELKTVQGDPWLVNNRLLFIGDAAHAMLPYLGQGMNCGLEDCRLLNEKLASSNTFLEAMQAFAETRKKDTDAITELSLRNYQEMCHKVVEADYLAKRQHEAELAKQKPHEFRNLYQKITYTNIPYSELL